MQNQSRLKVLKKREDLIKGILEDGQKKLGEVSDDSELYQKVLQKLISQSIFRLFETNVTLRCRKKDLSIVENSLDSVKKEFKDATKRDVQIKIDNEHYLSENM